MDIKKEEFVTCKSFNRYEMNRLGQVRNKKTGKLVPSYKNNSNKTVIKITVGNRDRTLRLAEMFALTFISREPGQKHLICISGNWDLLDENNFKWVNQREQVVVSDDKEWRLVVDPRNQSKRYEICEDGRIRNYKTGKIISAFYDKNGIAKVALYFNKNKRPYNCTVAVLMMRTWYGENDPPIRSVIYKDGNKQNLHKDNLEWGFPNQKHEIKTKRAIDEYDITGKFIRSWTSMTSASRTKGISYAGVCGCCNGLYKTAGQSIWRYKGEPLDKYPIPKPFDLFEGEKLCTIAGTEYNQVSSYGRIVNVRNGVKIRNIDKEGYITLNIEGKPTRRLAAKLVADAFLPNPNGCKAIGYIDGDKTNIRVDNLFWVKEENMKKGK